MELYGWKLIAYMACFLLLTHYSQADDWKNAKSVYEFTVKDIYGKDVSLEKYKGRVLIIVNVATYCGYTKGHYEGLNALYNKYHETHGLEILAFPCNQFGYQEPDSEEDICKFTDSINVKFDMFAKIDVNGDSADPLFKYLKKTQGGTIADFIKWNFTKFIINKNGLPVARHSALTSPLELEKELLSLMEEQPDSKEEL